LGYGADQIFAYAVDINIMGGYMQIEEKVPEPQDNRTHEE
jgi:hypothetical protein